MNSIKTLAEFECEGRSYESAKEAEELDRQYQARRRFRDQAIDLAERQDYTAKLLGGPGVPIPFRHND